MMRPLRPGLVACCLALGAVAAGPARAYACDCGPSCKCGSNCSCGQPAAQGGSLLVRKNQADLTGEEKTAFVNAILTLKSTTLEGHLINRYDEFVQAHVDAFDAGHAHGGPAFLPWHRQFLLDFEQALQSVDPSVTIPYWDFTVDNKPTSSLWKPGFLGGNGDPDDNYVVKTGPFAQGSWTLLDGTDLRRSFGRLAPSLPTADDVAAALGITTYDSSPYDEGSLPSESFRNNLEGWDRVDGPALHNLVHAWLGGSSALEASPNDPVFWLIHANIDRIWAEWEDANGLNYVPAEGARDGHNLHDVMSPFNVSPADVLDVRALGYQYDTQTGGAGFSSPASPNPEPASVVLLAAGGAGLLVYGWRRRRRA